MEKFDVECLNGNEKWVLYETIFIRFRCYLSFSSDTHFGSNLNLHQVDVNMMICDLISHLPIIAPYTDLTWLSSPSPQLNITALFSLFHVPYCTTQILESAGIDKNQVLLFWLRSTSVRTRQGHILYILNFNIISNSTKCLSRKFERGIKFSQHVKDFSSGTFWQFYALQNNRKRQFWV